MSNSQPKKTGRPLANVDATLVEKLASIHCTMKEIAAVCDCSVDTLERRFADVIEKGRDKGKSALRRLQWDAAQKGNVTMMIFLGKQLLGQSDKVEQLGKYEHNQSVKVQSSRVTEMLREFQSLITMKESEQAPQAYSASGTAAAPNIGQES